MMRWIAITRRLLSAPWRRKTLAAEAALCLLWARLDSLRPASHFLPKLGHQGCDAALATEEQVRDAFEIGQMLSTVSSVVPFRAACLQQALAGRRMLKRRGIPATIHLGLSLSAQDDPDGAAERHALALSVAGDRVINGDGDLEQFAVLGSYS